MRLMPLVLALVGLVPASLTASPIVPSSGGYGWADGQTRGFVLTWDGQQAVFSVDGIGSASYGSVAECCGDLLDRAGEIRPGGHFELSRLVINSIPLSTTVQDTLDLAMLRQTALHNLGRLSGDLTLRWTTPGGTPPTDDPYGNHLVPTSRYASMMVRGEPGYGALTSTAVTGPPPQVPEPTTALLVGLGLLGAASLARRRLR